MRKQIVEPVFGQIKQGQWSMTPVVTGLPAMRGVALVAAVTVAAEVDDFRRFANARQLMAYLGAGTGA